MTFDTTAQWVVSLVAGGISLVGMWLIALISLPLPAMFTLCAIGTAAWAMQFRCWRGWERLRIDNRTKG